jgi:hypothetical protein
MGSPGPLRMFSACGETTHRRSFLAARLHGWALARCA